MSPIENLEQRLAAQADAFDDAPADTGSLFELPPDGDYQASVYEFDFFEGGDTRAFMKIVFQIEHDENYTGRRAEIVYSLEEPERFRFLKADLKKLGAEPGSYQLTDLVPGSELLKQLLDTPVEIRVTTDKKGRINEKTGQVYRNVYLKQRLGEPGSAAAGFTPRSDIPLEGMDGFTPAPQAAVDDDIPF